MITNVEEALRLHAFLRSLEHPQSTMLENWEETRRAMGISHDQVAQEAYRDSLRFPHFEPLHYWLYAERNLLERKLAQICTAVRRNQNRQIWQIVDPGKESLGEFLPAALLSAVLFVHNPRQVRYLEHNLFGWGEVLGFLQNNPAILPQNVRRSANVEYDMGKRIFHKGGDPDARIDHADYLELCSDGRAIAGWVN